MELEVESVLRAGMFKLITFVCSNFNQILNYRDNFLVAPSGVQKERLRPEDLFLIDKDGKIIDAPAINLGLKISQCTPLFLQAYNSK